MKNKNSRDKKIIITIVQICVIVIAILFTFKNSSSPLIEEMFGNFNIYKGINSIIIISLIYLSLYLVNKFKRKK